MTERTHNVSGRIILRRIKQILFWMFAAALLFFIFSNREYDINLRLVLVGIVTTMGFSISVLINKVLIPRFLFRDQLLKFYYLLGGLFLISLWVILISVFVILLFSMHYLPEAVIPGQKDVVILLTGNYLIVILAGVIHFIKESYHRQMEKNQLERASREMELKLKETRLKVLQDQIHPHFIFNMLNNLYGLVAEDAAQSRKVILKLSSLLEYMLYECNEPLIPLKKELDFILNYIDLERIRREAFNLQISFADNTESEMIAPLVLFPFVENAFKHGLSNEPDAYIKLSHKIIDRELIFMVQNSIVQHPGRQPGTNGHGIGLENIQQRLSLIYQNKYDLQINNDGKDHHIQLKIQLK
ncbi:sensor histidine kinase [Marinilabilia sp.]